MRILALFVSIVCISAEITASASDRVITAQAGSTGGAIGKQGKSMSGEDVPVSRPVRPEQKNRSSSSVKATTEKPNAATACGKLAGLWGFMNGVDVVFKSDRSASATNGVSGTYSCADGMYTVNWSSGFSGRFTLSSDGKRLSGLGNFGDSISATRK